MSMGKIVALMAATSAVAFTAATIGTKVVISKLNLKNKKNSIDLGEVTQSQKRGSEQSVDRMTGLLFPAQVIHLMKNMKMER